MIGELPVSMEIEQCLKLVNEHFPGVIPNNLQNTSLNRDGWGSLVLDIDDAYIFRFPRRPEVLAGYSKEKALLPVIARALPVAIPVFEFIAMDDLDYRRCFIGYRKIHGEPWSLELAKSHPITDQLAHFLSALHQFPVERAAQLKALSVDSANADSPD
jgi:aminoglycoside phosphotransferase (APT) family kinase protein